jgi:hypothetical protein
MGTRHPVLPGYPRPVSPAAALRSPFRRTEPAEAGPRGAPVRARAADLALSVAVAATSLVLLAHGGLEIPASRAHELDPTRTLLAIATAVPLAGWRRWPLGAFTLIGLASSALAARGDILWPPVGLAAALYLYASRRGDTAPWTPVSRAVVGGVLLAYLASEATQVGGLIHSVLALAAAWFAGERTRLRRVQLSELRDRADQAEHAAVRERELAEALTNAARYGTGTTEITLGYAADAVDLTVSNAVKSGSTPGKATGGHGVIGMHERAASLDGELTAEAHGDRFLVQARVPYRGRAG